MSQEPPNESSGAGDAELPARVRASASHSSLPSWFWRRGVPIGLASLAIASGVLMVSTLPEVEEEAPVSLPAWTRGEDPRRFVAVLPLANLSDDPRFESFAAGMTDELISCLGRAHPQRLGVIARSSVQHLRGAERDLLAVAEDLQVDYVIEGSVRVSGTRVRTEVRLQEVRAGLSRWSQGFWRDFGELYSMQGEICEGITASLALEVMPADPAVVEALGSEDDRAYAEYIEGRCDAGGFAEGGLRESLAHYGRAVEFDPDFAQCRAAMAESWASLAMRGEEPARAYDEAVKAAEGALAIREALPTAWRALGLVSLFRDWNWSESERAFRRAVTLDPGDAKLHQGYSCLLSAAGREDEAIEQALAALQLDPLSVSLRADLAWCYAYADRHEEAVAAADRALAYDAGAVRAKRAKYWAHRCLGDVEGALAAARELQSGATDDRLDQLEGMATEEALAHLIDRRLADRLAGERAGPYELAVAYADAGRVEEGLEQLREALETRQLWCTYCRVDPRVDGLRAHPAFAALLEEAGPGRAGPSPAGR